MNFSYYLPTKITFGFGALEGLQRQVDELRPNKALLVTDKVMVKSGIADRVRSNIRGTSVDVFDGVEPEPRIEVAQEAAQTVRRGGYDLILGLGGGSSMDMAKVSAAFATNEGQARSYVGNNTFTKRGLPSIMIPTTAGTGAELTVTSMVTVDGHKQWINSPLLLPTAALVDPELTMSMPQSVTGATGMDALCHNAEAFLSGAASPITDSAALEGIRLIAASLAHAFDDGTDRQAREAMSLGALMGGIALQGKMVYGHSIGYTIATRFKLAHGVSCGIPLPYIIANYAIASGPKMAAMSEAFGVAAAKDDPAGTGKAIGEKVMGLLEHLKIPTTLRELGVKEGDLPTLARECLELYPRPNSPLVFDEKSMTHFYHMMWEGQLSA